MGAFLAGLVLGAFALAVALVVVINVRQQPPAPIPIYEPPTTAVREGAAPNAEGYERRPDTLNILCGASASNSSLIVSGMRRLTLGQREMYSRSRFIDSPPFEA